MLFLDTEMIILGGAIVLAGFVFWLCWKKRKTIANIFSSIRLHPLEIFFLAITVVLVILLFHSKNAIEFWVSIISVVIVAVYAGTAVIIVSRERIRSEELVNINRKLRELDEERNDFTAMVAHQLRSPIGGIRIAAASLADGTYGELPIKARETSKLIQNAAERLLRLAETYLQGLRLHQGTYVPKFADTNARAVIQTVVQELSPLVELKGLTVNVEFNNVPDLLNLEDEVLTNSLFNLLDNAVKYTDKGGVNIQTSWKLNKLTVMVNDTGVGMNKDELKTAFGKFARGKSARARQEAGTGLGLYIVKKLVQAAGGQIQAKSQGLGMGANFTISLPAKLVDVRNPGK